jgi:hypothetical protein
MAKQIVMYATGDTSLARASRAFDAQHVQFAGNIAKGAGRAMKADAKNLSTPCQRRCKLGRSKCHRKAFGFIEISR